MNAFIKDDLLHLDPEREPDDILLLNFEAWEGPLDVLLHLARSQKVDLAAISILALVDQYIAFIRLAKRLKIELAADYLVMAAWLTYLKSKLLIPKARPEDESEGEEIVRDLTFHLARLAAMREKGQELFERARLGQWRWQRGEVSAPEIREKVVYTANLHDLLKGYARLKTNKAPAKFNFERPYILSIEEALERLQHIITKPLPLWTELRTFLPEDLVEPEQKRSGMASTLVAALELAKSGRISLKQETAFGPILLKSPDDPRGDLL